jgi:hypothetical protein
MNAAAILEADERRAARDSYVRTGGSQRRPLKSFMTAAEKKDARQEHAARIHAAVAELAEPGGFTAWLEALDLNPHLSPMNCALVAYQSPGEIVNSSAGWKRQGYRVRKGERCAGRITAPGFWPLAYFVASQALASDLEGFFPTIPPIERRESLRSALMDALAEGTKPRLALEAIAAEVRS